MAAKFAYTNLLQTAGAVIVPSSELASMPRANLLRPGISSRLRFQSGWTVAGVTGVTGNTQIRFDRGGVKTAGIVAGYYATPTAYAEAVRVAMVAADATPTWVVTYATNKFTIATSSGHSFTLLFAGAFPASAHPDLGFATTDTGSATTHTAGSVAYQSRHWVNVDLGSAIAATSAIVRGHNVSAAGQIRIDGNVVTMVDEAIGPASADYSEVLVGTDPRVVLFASVSKRYLRLVIEDVQNPAGYSEIGVWFTGTYGQPTVLPSVQYAKDNEHLSEVHFAEGGAHHKVSRTRRRVYKLLFQLEERGGLAIADRALFDAIDALGIGTSLFMILDVVNDAAITVYGFNRVGLHEVYVQGTLWAIVMEFSEALG